MALRPFGRVPTPTDTSAEFDGNKGVPMTEDFTNGGPSLPDLRARVLAGEELSDDEIVAVVRKLSGARQNAVAQAAEKAAKSHVDLDAMFVPQGQTGVVKPPEDDFR